MMIIFGNMKVMIIDEKNVARTIKCSLSAEQKETYVYFEHVFDNFSLAFDRI